MYNATTGIENAKPFYRPYQHFLNHLLNDFLYLYKVTESMLQNLVCKVSLGKWTIQSGNRLARMLPCKTTIMSSRLLGSASPLGKYLCRSQQVRLYVMVEGKLKGIYI
jgi:hypothetical protein